MFQCQQGYTLQRIKDQTYLLPYGQQIADHKRGTLLNETGAFLWNALQQNQGATIPQLAEQLAKHYNLKEETFPILQTDVETFVDQMFQMGFLVESLKPSTPNPSGQMEIAGLSIRFYGLPEFYTESFQEFLTPLSEDTPDQEIEFITAPPYSRTYGQVLLQNSEMSIYQNKDRYVIRFPQMENLEEVHMTPDGSYARFYCSPEMTTQNKENLFHAIRLVFLYLAQQKGRFAIHSASILYKEKAWLFSGHSGMGKSTHTGLWHQLLGTPYLNGDLNLLGIQNGKIMVYGIPWCGTSGLFTTETKELGGIVLLGRSLTGEEIQELAPYEKTLRVMQRMISPAWTEQLLSLNLTFADQLSDQVPVLQLSCTKNPSAVYTIQHEMDRLEVES